MIGNYLKWIFSHFDHGIGNLPSKHHCVDGGKTSNFFEGRQLCPQRITLGNGSKGLLCKTLLPDQRLH